MLDAWIIEELKKKDKIKKENEERPTLRLPMEEDSPFQNDKKDIESEYDIDHEEEDEKS